MRRPVLTAAQEQDLAWAARNAEADARQILAPVAEQHESVAALLGGTPRRRGRTRAPLVQLLEAAVAEAVRLKVPQAGAAGRALGVAMAARWELALSGTRIALGEARKVAGPMAAEDLSQEGFVGLYNAALRFDPARGLRFSTYARWWARAAITRAIDQKGRPVRMPAGAIEQRRNLLKLLRDADRAGRTATVQELAARLGLSNERITALQESLDDTTSIDAQVDGRSLLDTMADPAVADPVEVLYARRSKTRIGRALATLPPREALVVSRVFGLDGAEPMTLTEIGQQLLKGVSKEWVRKLKEEGLDKLRIELAGER